MYRIYHGSFCNQIKRSDNSSAGEDVYTLYMCRLRLIDKSTEQTTTLNQTLTKKKLFPIGAKVYKGIHTSVY